MESGKITVTVRHPLHKKTIFRLSVRVPIHKETPLLPTGWTRGEVAEYLGSNCASVRSWENGRVPHKAVHRRALALFVGEFPGKQTAPATWGGARAGATIQRKEKPPET